MYYFTGLDVIMLVRELREAVIALCKRSVPFSSRLVISGELTLHPDASPLVTVTIDDTLITDNDVMSAGDQRSYKLDTEIHDTETIDCAESTNTLQDVVSHLKTEVTDPYFTGDQSMTKPKRM